MLSKYKNILSSVAKFTVAIGLIYWLIKSDLLNVSNLMSVLGDYRSILVCFSLVFVNIFINHWRWYLLLKAREIKVGLIDSLPLSFIGLFFNFAIPGSVGGDVVKAYYIAKDNPTRKLVSAMTVLMDRLIGLYAMAALASLTILIHLPKVKESDALMSLGFISFSIFAAMSVLIALSISQRFSSLFQGISPKLSTIPGIKLFTKFFNAFKDYRYQYKVLISTFMLSLLSQTTAICFFAYIGHVIGVDQFGFAVYFLAVPLGFIVSSVPIAPAGIGVGQVAFLFLFEKITGVQDLQVGQTAISVFQIIQLCWGLLGAYFYLTRKGPTLAEVSA